MTVNGQDVRASFVRTAVPFLVAWVSTWLPKELGITTEQLTAAAGLLVGAAWFLGARLLEVYVSPVLGKVLLGFGVFGAPSYGRHEAGRPPADGGWVRPSAVAAVGAAVLLCLLAPIAARADVRPTRHPGAVHIGVTGLSQCRGVLTVHFGIERRAGDAWVYVPDDGTSVTVELHFIGNGAGPGGQWSTVEVLLHPDNIRAVSSSRPTFDSVRVRHHGVASTPWATSNAAGCS